MEVQVHHHRLPIPLAWFWVWWHWLDLYLSFLKNKGVRGGGSKVEKSTFLELLRKCTHAEKEFFEKKNIKIFIKFDFGNFYLGIYYLLDF